ncbi:MAG: hypothetical protein V7L13_09565 [Nostoc sp.]|uniref:hypothetical protein n=1 Tax=Nostoc sp. TaxID=1180 RepID=UPI002FFA3C47
MPYYYSEIVEFDENEEKYCLIKLTQHDCVTYQCVDDPDKKTFIRWLTDKEVSELYPALNE